MVVLGQYNCGSICMSTKHEDTRVKYTSASGLPDLSLDIRGTLDKTSIPSKEHVLELRVGLSVQDIGDEAFTGCSRMTYVELPDNL